MKKTIILIFLILFLVGCEETKKKVKEESNLLNEITLNSDEANYICSTYDRKNKEYNLAGKYAIYLDENSYVIRIESSEIVESSDEDNLNQLLSYFNSNYQNIANYGGFTYDIYQENDYIYSNVIIDYSMLNVESFITDYPEEAEYFDEEFKIKKDKLIEFYKNKGIECEKK